MMIWVVVWIIPFGMAQMLTHLVNPTARNFKRWGGAWSRLILLFGGIRLKTHGGESLDGQQPYVFVCNHQSGLDIWSNLAGIDHPFAFIAKASLRRVPMLGQVLQLSASLFVDRSSPRKAVRSIVEAAERIRKGNSVLIYPEGMRTWSPQTVDFMKGAYQLAVKAGVPIVPVALMNSYELYDERAKASRPGTVHMVIGDPVETDALQSSAIPELIDTTRGWIQECLDRFHSGVAPPFKTDASSVSSPVQ